MVSRLRFDLAGLIGGQDFALALAQHLHERLQARPQPLDHARIDANGPGQVLFGQLAAIAIEKQMLKRRRHHIRRRRRRTGEVHRVELLVRMNDAAEAVNLTHVGNSSLNYHHRISYVILPCFCDREIRSPAYSPASTNSMHEARTASFSLGLTSKALSQAFGTRLRRSAY